MVDFRNHRVSGLPLLAGFVNGLLAYVAGLVGSLLLFVVLGWKPLVGMAFGLAGGLSFFDAVGFVFYGGHLASVSTAEGSVNFALDLAANGFAYVLLVAVVLGGTGYYLGSADWVGTAPLGFVVGGLQVIGYLPLAVLGTVLFSVELGTDVGIEETASTVTMSVSTVEGVVLAGILFPVLLGGLGGALAART